MNRLPFAHKGGSIFAAMFGAVAMMGVVGVAAMNMIGGPITTASKVTHQNMAQNDLLMNAKIVVMNASTRPNQGDEDGDGYVEPVPFIPTSASSCNITLPAGSSGGCLPADIGAILTDPWGTQYMYCVWDHGDPASSTNRITGEDSTSGAVLAIISAGPNKRFETPCRAYDGDPSTNDDAVNPDGNGDDLIQIYTYAAAVAGSGGLWELKQNEPETAIINKKLEIGDISSGTGFAFDTETGQGEFPYVKTDFIASKTGGNTPVTMVNNIALDGNWLSGDGGNEGVFVAANGNVGVGVTAPLSKLHIIGAENTGIDAALRIQSGSQVMLIDGNEIITTAESGSALYLNSEVPNNVVLAAGGGNVGIGTGSPQEKLHVSGGPIYTGSMWLGKSGAIATAPDIHMNVDGFIAADNSLHLGIAGAGGNGNLIVRAGGLTSGTSGEILRVTKNGYVGIRTTNPTHELHILGTGGEEGTTSLFLQDPTTNDQYGARFYFDDTNGQQSIKLSAVAQGVDTGYLMIDRDSGRIGINTIEPMEAFNVGRGHLLHTGGAIVHYYNSYYTPGANRFAGYHDAGNEPMSAAYMGLARGDGGFSIKVSGNKGMKGDAVSGWSGIAITPGGNVGIGTDAPRGKLTVGNISHSSGGPAGNFANYSLLLFTHEGVPNSSYGIGMESSHMWFNTGGGYKFYYAGNHVSTIGNNGAYTQISDERLKENITPIEDALDKVTALNGVTFTWKDNRAPSRDIGLVAQNVQEAFPEAVQTDQNGMMSVNYSSLVSPMIEAIKELKAENDALRTEIEEIKSRMGH